MFWFSIIFFIVMLIGFVVVLCLWTYADAKVRTDKPRIWTLIVLLTPNLFGLIIYLLVGRTKMGTNKNKFKTPAIVLAVGLLVAVGIFVGTIMTADGTKIPTWKGVSIGMIEHNAASEWIVSFKASGEEITRKVSLNEDELQEFKVKGQCEEGTLALEISQGDYVETFDISSSSETRLDLSNFQPGKIKLTITNDSAKSANIVINWQKEQEN